jgi:UPF0716 protein FxsA
MIHWPMIWFNKKDLILPMRFFILLLLLAFPIAEIMVLIQLFDRYGIWVLLYLVVVGLLGLQLIKEEKLLFSGRMMQGLTQGGNPIKAMFGSARNMIAGVLLMVPGVITDVIAALLLLIPLKSAPKAQPNTQSDQPYQDAPFQEKAHQGEPYKKPKAANDNVIEGEYRRED